MTDKKRKSYEQKPAPINQPKPRKQQIPLMTDEEQRAINQGIAMKHAMPLSTRILRPGDPEFDNIAKLYK